ncbi:hypothetical protein [Streptomyces sp. NPDC000931]|uniref:hypothetical protein n=1 Tax=Streptomyces sp. NPDC000931 TaxID=3154372 RepID=UPI0033197376
MTPISRWAAAALTPFAVVLCTLVLQPALGLKFALGYAVITAVMLWWQWSITRSTAHGRTGSWISVPLLALVATFGYNSGVVLGLSTVGSLGYAIAAIALFLPALCVAVTERQSPSVPVAP